MAITLGEYIAAANARSFASFFASKNLEIYSSSYAAIAADEKRHFALLKSIIPENGRTPAQIRAIYKGSLLSTPPSEAPDSVFERMAVMHTVFEGAAFAYMVLLSKYEFSDPNLDPIRNIAKIVMLDEARHMAEGFAAIDFMKKHIIADKKVKSIRKNVQKNAEELRLLPDLAEVDDRVFKSKLIQLYDENVEKNMKRVFK